MNKKTMTGGMGWLPDLPDFRDYSIEQNELSPKLKALGQKDAVKAMLRKTGFGKSDKAKMPLAQDLRQWCSRIEDQGELGSCTANAGVGLLEYFERRAFGKHIDASRLFLYKATRNLMQQTGDTGAYLRTTMGALALFGVVPEEYWPYATDQFDAEPPAFCYSFAQNYQSIQYFRLDPAGIAADKLLKSIKELLVTEIPSMFGFTVYNSIQQAAVDGKIPFPARGEKVLGGHAVVAVGYDDRLVIKNRDAKGGQTKGALLIRNSWGEEWGDGGYGWLPYEYVLRGLADDFWSLLKNEWIDTGVFAM